MDDKDLIDFFSKQELTKGLRRDELQFFCTFFQIEELTPGSYIVQEGDQSRELYFIFKGEVDLLKWDEEKVHLLNIGKLKQGSFFGEMAFLDAEPRSVTVKASTDTTILKLSPDDIDVNDPFIALIYQKIVHNIATINIQRLRTTNQSYVKSLRAQIDELELRNNFGFLFITVIILFGLENILQMIVVSWNLDPGSTVITWMFMFCVLIPLLVLVKRLGLKFDDMGVTTRKGTISIIEGLGASIILILIFMVAYLAITSKQPGAPTLFHVILNPTTQLTVFSVISYLVVSYLQEFIARGVGMTSIQKFLDDKKGYKSIVISSFLFGIFHLYRGLDAGIVTFFGSIVLGYAYIRHKNLIESAILHFVLGSIAINYLGVV